jgi:hypothetical protein
VKGAAHIANHFHSVDDVIAAAENDHSALTPALTKKILAGRDYLAIAPTLVHCARDIALPNVSLALPKYPKDMKLIRQMQEKYALGTSVDRLVSALQW